MSDVTSYQPQVYVVFPDRVSAAGDLRATEVAPWQWEALARACEDMARGDQTYLNVRYPAAIVQGNGMAQIEATARRFCQGHGADIGGGQWPLPGAALVVEAGTDGPSAEDVAAIPDASLDYIFSSHCLEHLDDWETALRGWRRCLRPGGVIFLYLPHPDCALWRPGSPYVLDHKHVMDPVRVQRVLVEMGCRIVEATVEPDAFWSFYVAAEVP